MKKRIVSILLAVCLVAGLCSVLGTTASAYSTDYPNTHVNTGDQRADVVQIAQTQIGYTEDPGTKYGAWWGQVTGQGDKCIDNPWCVYFALWCLDQSGCTAGYSGLSGESSSLLKQYLSGKNGNTAYQFGSGYMPRPGDLIFVGTGKNASAPDHVGLIVSVDGDMIYTVEGNYSDKVSRSSYSLATGDRSNSVRTILYFGVPAYANDSAASFDGPVVKPEEPAPEEPETGINYKTTVKTGLNVRSAPSTTASVLTSLYAGQEVTIVDEADGDNGHRWGKLSTGGWICLYYTSAGDAGSGANPTEPEAPSETPVERYEATVSCDLLNVRSTPGTSGSVSGQLRRGDKVTITAVATADGLEWGKTADGGWVATKYLTRVEAPSEPETPEAPEAPAVSVTGTVTASVLNIRSTPGTGSVVGTYSRGQTVKITETKTVDGKSWGKTADGWISMEYVKTDSAPETPAEPEAPAEGGASVSITGTVTASVLNVRATPGTGAVVGACYQGQTVEITETKTVDGTTWGKTADGWISMDYVRTENGGSGSGTACTVKADVVNVRSGAGTDNPVTSTLTRGTAVTIVATKTGSDGRTWGQLASGGWVCMDYVG